MRPALSILLLAIPGVLLAELTPAQRETDFRTLAAVYARHYGPMNWKYEAFRYDGLDLGPWLPRVRAARTDLEFLDICAEYTAALDDGHTGFRNASNLNVNLGINVDIYDGKVLIETIDRRRYPMETFPFALGDELVSLDGRTAEEWITYFSRLRKMGNPRTTRRNAADAITFRPQAVYASAALVEDTSVATIRRANGETATYTLTWVKTGEPMLALSPLPDLRAKQAGLNLRRATAAVQDDRPEAERNLDQIRTWRADPADPLLERFTYTNEVGQEQSEGWLRGWGQPAPVWAFPASYNFQRRLTTPFFSGTYQYQGKRIGYIRIPGFGGTPATVTLFENEINFFKANTDGLVVDVQRNTGGGCIGVDYLLRLVPGRITTFKEQFRVTQNWLNIMQSNLQFAEATRAEPWVIETWRYYLKAFEETYRENRGMTGPLPQCAPMNSPGPVEEWPPLRDAEGRLTAYDKPIILLADEFSVSFGDIFPAMFQDIKRGPVVGMRTAGWGAQNSSWLAGPYSEAFTSCSRTLVERFTNVVSPEFPTRPYIENIGILPDVELDIMTRENLLNNGATFVEGFSRILLGRIQ